MSGDTSEKLVTTTVQEYDQSQLKSALKGVLMGVAMMAGMHLYMKYTNPLVIQSTYPFPFHAPASVRRRGQTPSRRSKRIGA